MTVSTYGEHAERAAEALDLLVRSDVIPAEENAVRQLLHCREAVTDALRERLRHLGKNRSGSEASAPPTARSSPMLSGLDVKLATLVSSIAFALPTLPPDDRSAWDYLAPSSADPAVEAWRVAAIELLSGSHALSAAAEQPWWTDPGAGWWVLRDAAVALEAVLVLDSRLEEVGLLARHHRPDHVLGPDEMRMVLSQAARVAMWHATSAAAEEAVPRLQTTYRSLTQPVVLVSAPADLAAAQQQLARLLRPLSAGDAFYVGEPEISADAARHVTAAQIYLCRALKQSPLDGIWHQFFSQRLEVLESLRPQLEHLADVQAVKEPRRLRLWQTGELTTALARMKGRGTAIRLQPTQAAELAQATHDVTHNLAKTLRRELLRQNTNLVDAHPRHREGETRVGRRSRLARTVTDLVNLPAPKEQAARFSTPLQRAALQRSVDLTPPLCTRPPTPFPVTHPPTCRAEAI